MGVSARRGRRGRGALRGAMGGLWGGWRHLVDLSVCATELERGGAAAFQDLNEREEQRSLNEINRRRMDI